MHDITAVAMRATDAVHAALPKFSDNIGSHIADTNNQRHKSLIYNRPLDPVTEPITEDAAMPDPQAPATAAGRGTRCDNPDCGLAIWVARAVAAMAGRLAETRRHMRHGLATGGARRLRVDRAVARPATLARISPENSHLTPTYGR
jgi:hypothetical protein